MPSSWGPWTAMKKTWQKDVEKCLEDNPRNVCSYSKTEILDPLFLDSVYAAVYRAIDGQICSQSDEAPNLQAHTFALRLRDCTCTVVQNSTLLERQSLYLQSISIFLLTWYMDKPLKAAAANTDRKSLGYWVVPFFSFSLYSATTQTSTCR